MGLFSRVRSFASSVRAAVSSAVASVASVLGIEDRPTAAPSPPPSPPPSPSPLPVDDIAGGDDDDDDAEADERRALADELGDVLGDNAGLPDADDIEFEQAMIALEASGVSPEILDALRDMFVSVDGDLDAEGLLVVEADEDKYHEA